MNAAFDMETEIVNLAQRIVGPVATKLAQQDLDAAIGQIRHVLEQLNAKRPSADVNFENIDRIPVRFEHAPSPPGSWPGLSRPPRLSLLCAFKFEVAGTSAATTRK